LRCSKLRATWCSKPSEQKDKESDADENKRFGAEPISECVYNHSHVLCQGAECDGRVKWNCVHANFFLLAELDQCWSIVACTLVGEVLVTTPCRYALLNS
jgi:hypothetical protein